MLHDEFLDLGSGPIGRVVTSEEFPATAHEFFFWTAESEEAQRLDIGHIVAAEAEDATAIAALDDPRRYSDLQSFLDDFYAYDGDPALEALSERVEILVFRARVLATKHRDERKKSKRPVKTGPVYFATSEAIEFALGAEDFSGTKIPMLLHENGNEKNGSPQRTPLYADADYLLGPEAGHLNITGMSGLSTKTSHALFTISSIFQKAEDKKAARRTRTSPPATRRSDRRASPRKRRRCTRRWSSKSNRSRTCASSRLYGTVWTQTSGWYTRRTSGLES